VSARQPKACGDSSLRLRLSHHFSILLPVRPALAFYCHFLARPISPEDRARENIDRLLTGAGWIVQSRNETNLSAGRGIAIREFPLENRLPRSRLSPLRRRCSDRRSRSKKRRNHPDRLRNPGRKIQRWSPTRAKTRPRAAPFLLPKHRRRNSLRQSPRTPSP
jgi:hypothetical protein